ncbi:GntR family transcriptional regulator [Streptomyces endophyticus]|uniref:GntR family transcriptional regulator n=1 Tax=Streptomyces endophyticus TaxID=714166 RepID=A0ABU6F9B7_9ACTN|nr:GntR family transcriptional regulator [Streptomyces endophyticus]MEB8340232.1 GntR family transcriptional regulator [Streptomyces endophyticus]
MSGADRTRRADAMSTDAVTDELRRLVVEGIYPPGHRLVQEELADRFGVSRIPLREAMRTLISEGLLRSAGRGTFVTALDLDEIDEIYTLRRLVEPSFAEHVTDRASRRDIGRFEEMVADMDRVHETGADAWSRTNLAFHLDMYRMSRLPLRYEVISQMYHRLEPYSRFYVHGTSAYERVQHEHAAMVQAVKDGNAEELARQIVAHIDGGQQGLHAAWENSNGALQQYWAGSNR